MVEEFKFWKEINHNIHGHRYYEVSNLGRVKINGELIEPKLHSRYLYITSHILLHRVVAELFVPNPDNKPEVDHIDTNRLNNRVDNLRWVTRKENCNNKITKERYKLINKGRIQSEETLRKRSKPVLQYTLDNEFVTEYVSIREAIRQTKIIHIVDCCKNKAKSAGGYIWKYKNI